ncbi:MAG: hypothetical protein JRF37_07495 [Deltaproteobacteria bacterium]|jgi:hypothetical protein|nr:hypothetical protein [Deltaproteobacteria bacterium]OEU46096.1 MAG: hypothetical protein BBJ60_12085 [Desulfobacterales bacterium S7086C20]
MRKYVLCLKVFGWVWIALVFSVVIASLQPFNLKNYFITLAVFAPAFGAFVLARSLERKNWGRDL